jgi:hypothetical protein
MEIEVAGHRNKPTSDWDDVPSDSPPEQEQFCNEIDSRDAFVPTFDATGTIVPRERASRVLMTRR